MGRHDGAMQEIKLAQKLDPLGSAVNTAEGRILHFARRYDDAIAQFQKVLELDPNFVPAHLDLGASYEQISMFQEALIEFQTCATLSGGRPFYLAAVGEAYGRLGRKEEASKILSHLQEASNGEYVSPNDLCLVYAALGDKNKAFAWLETAYELGTGCGVG